MMLDWADGAWVASGRRLGEDGGGDGGNARNSDFTSESTVAENLGSRIEVASRVSGDNHDTALRVAARCMRV